jgi:serine/threonine protein kinase
MFSNNSTIIFSQENGTNFDCIILKELADSKYKVYLVSVEGAQYALKVFPYSRKALRHFSTEAAFTSLNHPNILAASRVGYCVENDKFFYLILSEFCEHGNFFEILKNKSHLLDEKMVRTYFKQLVDAVEYLHSQEVSHLDIKPANFFLDSNFRLRLADYDLAHSQTNPTFASGTENYRAPEQICGQVFDTQKADIFTLGVNLFVMKFAKVYPYSNFLTNRGYLENQPDVFWNCFTNHLGWKADKISNSFKRLFYAMTCEVPNQRPTITQIKESRWLQEGVYDQSEIEVIMAGILTD